MKGKWLQSALLIELHWPFSIKYVFKKNHWMSNYSFFFHWESWRVQPTLLHLDGNVKQVVIAFTPTKCRTKIKQRIQIHFLCYTTLILTYAFERVRRSKWLKVLEGKCSHCLSLFPWLAPDVDTMTADKDGTWIWVFLHCPSHPVFQVLLLWCVFNNRHNQAVIISMYMWGKKT